MRTTLKRGVGRGAGQTAERPRGLSAVRCQLGRPLPAAAARRRAPGSASSGGSSSSCCCSSSGSGSAAAGGALLWLHESISAVRPHSIDVKQAQKQLNVSRPGHAAIALVIGYDQRARHRLLGHLALRHGDDDPRRPRDEHDLAALDPARPRRPDLLPEAAADEPRRADGQPGVRRLCGSAGTLDTVKHFTNLPINYLDHRQLPRLQGDRGQDRRDLARHRPALLPRQQRHGVARTTRTSTSSRATSCSTAQHALDFVRYRHTDDDYHRIARQQEFVRALKQQFAQQLRATRSCRRSCSTLTHNVEVGGKAQRPDGARLAVLRVDAAGRSLLPGQDPGRHRRQR